MNKIPFFGKDRYYKENSIDILRIVDSIYSHGMVLMGPEVEEFEKKIANYCGRKYAVAVGSCTDALYFSLLANGIKPKDEVLVTGYSFIASASCISRNRSLPVFVDINPENYMMDLEDLERKITDKTRAIVAVHLFGNSLNIEAVEKIARNHNLIVVEDAAQSIGSNYGYRNVCTLGECSCVSFDPTKILSAQSNGGAILTDNQRLYELLAKMRYHGKSLKTGEFETLGFNSRLSSFQAALLSFNLDRLDGWIKKHREIAHKYKTELIGLEQLVLPKENGDSRHTFHKFVLQVKDGKRDELKKWLDKNGIKTMIHYDEAIPNNKMFEALEHRAENLGNIYKVKSEVLSLPIHAWITDEEVSYIIKKIKEFYINN